MTRLFNWRKFLNGILTGRTAPLRRENRTRLCLEPLEDRTLMSVTWVNPSSGNWNVGANWSTGSVPGSGDDVVINTAAAVTVTIQSGNNDTVHSVTTGANDTLAITSGELTVTAGTSTLSGDLSMTGGALRASGGGATLTANGTTTVSEASLFAGAGATLSLPQLLSYSSNGTFQADGAGSLLNVSALTTVTQAKGGWNIDATNGGKLNLSGFTSLTSTNGINITDTGGSTLLDPNLTTLSGVSVSLDGSDAAVANAWTKLFDGSLYVSIGSYNLPGLNNIDQSGLHISNGGSLTLPNLTSYSSNGTFQADGVGSLLNVSALTAVTQPKGGWNIDATNGGKLNLSGFTSLTSTNGINITDTNGSTLLDPNLTTLSGVSVSLDGSDAAVANAWTKFFDGSLYVSIGSYNLPGLNNIDQSGLHISNGGSLTLPNLTSYSSNGTFQADGVGSLLNVSALTAVTQPKGGWNIDATNGGKLNLSGFTSLTSTNGINITDTNGSTLLDPNLTTLSGVSVSLDGSDAAVANAWTKFFDGSLYVSIGSYNLPGLNNIDQSGLHISNGGSLTLPNLTSYSSNGTFQADGAGSLLNVSALTTVTQAKGGWNIYATNGGKLNLSGFTSLTSTNGINITDTGGSTLLDPNLTTLSGVSVSLDGSDAAVANAWTKFFDGSLYVSIGSYNLPGLINIDQSGLHISNGGSLTLPNLTSYSSNGTFQADGAGSLLNVSALTTVTQAKGGWNIYATNGGKLNLSGFTSLTSTNGINITDTGGSTLLDPNLTALSGVSVSLDGSDAAVANAWTKFFDGSLYVSIGSYNLPGLINIDQSGLHISNGGSLTLPNLTSYSSNGTFQADGVGSLLNVSALTAVTQPKGGWNIDATNGGKLNLSGFTSLTSTNGINITDTNGSTLLDPNLTTLSGISVSLDGTDAHIADSWSTFGGGNFDITGGSITLPNLTNVSGSRIQARGGATLSLPPLTSGISGPRVTTTLEANGSGSTLTLANFAGLTVAPNSQAVAEALAGGVVNLQALTHVSGGPLALISDGNGSVLDVSNLTHFNSAGGTVAATNGGTIKHPAPVLGGPLTLNSATQGGIFAATLVNDWTFIGQAGQGITVTVVTGSQGFPNSWPPDLNYAQVSLTDAQGNVLATASNTQTGANVTLAGIALPALGTYHILVKAPAAQSSATGDYVITANDVTVHQFALTVNQTNNGILDAASAVDHWTFSAAANTQVQFNLLAAVNGATQFDLTGPGGFTAFSNATASSGLLTLPTAGDYVLTVHNAPGAYAFDLRQTAQANLALGTPLQGNLTSNGQAQLFKIVATGAGPLLVTLTDANLQDHNELYIQAATPPTRDVYDARAVVPASSNQALVIVARPGTYYVLVYDDVVQAAGTFTIEAQSAPFIVTKMTPNTDGNGFDTTMQFTGGFSVSLQAPAAGPGISTIADSPTVQFIGAGGVVLPATPIPLYYTGAQDPSGLPIVSASLPAHTLPAGTYSVRITDNGGYTVTLPTPITVVDGGVGQLDVKLTVPNPIGYHESSTFYVRYTNVGTAPMPAPLLTLTGTQKGQEGAFLTLDRALVTSGFWSDTTPTGYSQTVQFLAGGADPGVLQPGESVTVPVYYAGWLHTQWDFSRPPIIFSIGEADATATDTIDWAALKDGLRPSYIGQAAWNAIYPNLTAQLGTTSGTFVQAMDNDATYLGHLGDNTNDVSRLFSFEVEKANNAFLAQALVSFSADQLPTLSAPLQFQLTYQQPISGRYYQGLLGLGWTTNWDISASAQANGDVLVNLDGAGIYFALQSDGSYLGTGGSEDGTLSLSNGAFQIVAKGVSYQFNSNGTLSYVQDVYGNRITAAYNAKGQLASLTASNGVSFALTYNSQGHLAQLADSAGGSDMFSYDPTGQFLTGYTDASGTTTFAYLTGLATAQNNALASITNAANLQTQFGYDNAGRLTSESTNGTSQKITFSYGSAGGYTETDADGNATTVLYSTGSAEVIDPLGIVTRYEYNTNNQLSAVATPAGTTTYLHDADGNTIAATDPLGNTTTYTYTSRGQVATITDPNGNTTAYFYDANGNLLSTTFANGARVQMTYDAAGQLTKYIDADGNVAKYAYNLQGHVSTEQYSDGTTYSYTYDGRGNLLTITDSSGKITTLTYGDAQYPDHLTEVLYPDGTFLKYSYDAAGQRATIRDQTGYTVTYSYNSVGQLAQIADSNGTTLAQYTYDAAGKLKQTIDGNGLLETYAYDADGNMLKHIIYKPDHVTIQSEFDYTYNAIGQARSMVTGGVTTTYTYDADGRLIGYSNTAGVSVQYTLNANGSIVAETYNGTTTSFTVNNVNETTAATANGATVASWTYDANGNAISSAFTGGTVTDTYNARSQLTSSNGLGTSANLTYNAFGSLVAETVNGTTFNYVTDPLSGMIAYASSSTGGSNSFAIGPRGDVSFYDHDPTTVYFTYGKDGQVEYYSGTPDNPTFLNGPDGAIVQQYQPIPEPPPTPQPPPPPPPINGTDGPVPQPTGKTNTQTMDAPPPYVQPQPGPVPPPPTPPGNNPNPPTPPTPPDPPAGDCYINFAYTFLVPIPDLPILGLGAGVATQIDNNGNVYLSAGPSAGIGEPGGSGAVTFGNAPVSTGFGATASFTGGGTTAVIPINGVIPGVSANPEGGAASGFGAAINGSYTFKIGHIDLPFPIPCPPKPKNPPTPKPPTKPGPGGSTSPVTSQDPNSLIGPAGFGVANFIAGSALLPYIINFENAPTASAPAQRVDISNQLDANLDPSTFQLTGIGWGSVNLAIPAGSRSFSDTVPMTENGKTFNVVVTASISPSGLLTVSFQSIDPNTNLPPDILTGFLPPNDRTATSNGTGRGTGYVTYTVQAKAGVATGAQIHNVALVTFDQGLTIATDQVNDEDPSKGIDPAKQALNTIDAVAPTSTVAALPSTENPAPFTVSWSGTDDAGGSGIASYNVYVSDNGGPFTLFQTATTQTSATFTGQLGHTYGFYSVATDNTGNVQATPAGAQASTRIANTPLSITTTALATNWTAGAAGYSQTIAISGGSPPATFTVSAGSLPAGLSLAASTGVISGTPTTAGSSTFTITATDSASGTANHAYTVVVLPPQFVYDQVAHTVAITLTAALPSFTFSQVTTASGGTTSSVYTFTLSGSAPTVSQSFTDAQLTIAPAAGGVAVTVIGQGLAGTAILITNDTYLDQNGQKQETPERISLGSLTDAGVGTMSKFVGNSTSNPSYSFLSLKNFPISYAYAGRNDGTIMLQGTQGTGKVGFVTAGYYSYIAAAVTGLYAHFGEGTPNVIGTSAGNADDFAYHYTSSSNTTVSTITSVFTVNGITSSSMTGSQTNPEDGGAIDTFNNLANGFVLNTAVSYTGNSIAYINDSALSDTYVGQATDPLGLGSIGGIAGFSYMYEGASPAFGEFDVAYGFGTYYASATNGGHDIAYPGAPANDVFSGDWIRAFS